MEGNNKLKEPAVYFAHSANGDGKPEPLAEHLRKTAGLCGEFCIDFGAEKLGTMTGLLHDIGKYQKSFQERLNGKKIQIEHSICGAKEVFRLLSGSRDVLTRQMIAYAIASHHSGLPDFGTEADNEAMPTLTAKLKRSTEDYDAYKNELADDINTDLLCDVKQYLDKYRCTDEKSFALSFMARMLFSALCDADSLATEMFYMGKARNFKAVCFDELLEKLNKRFTHFNNDTKVNAKRNQIRGRCEKIADNGRGIFSLTVPTGGGKTLSSMIFALKHAIKNRQRRIIYVIPYTAIIEQTAKVFKDIFGEENVLEHHSNAIFETDTNEDTPQYLATENWDLPIILTTNVQFFESLFSNKRGKARKLHNISNSVIIFDEAQMLPIQYLKPCLKAADILVRNFNCSVLLMSATCPDYKPYMHGDTIIREINDNFEQDYKELKRVSAEFIGNKTDDELCHLIKGDRSSLIVVNSRRHAKILFDKINVQNKYHLSTLMTPNHRKEILTKIRDDLANNKSCVVVSTQLIECGVDLDFDLVYRSLAGIDSIVQAGGRCNREGTKRDGKVYIFESHKDPTAGDIPIYKSISRTICQESQNGNKDIFELENIQNYFEKLLGYRDKETDKKDILRLFQFATDGKKMPLLKFDFAECDKRFCYIDSEKKYEIIIAKDEESNKLLNELQNNKLKAKELLRKLGGYMVSVYKCEYEALLENHCIDKVTEDGKLLKLIDLDLYSPKIGLNLSGDGGPLGNYII